MCHNVELFLADVKMTAPDNLFSHREMFSKLCGVDRRSIFGYEGLVVAPLIESLAMRAYHHRGDIIISRQIY